MALVAGDVEWRLSGASSDGGAQSNPALSLGRFASSSTFAWVDSTLTAAASSGAVVVVDSARIGGPVPVDAWLVFVSGPLGGAGGFFVSRVVSLDTTTGAWSLDRALPAGVSSGNRYLVFESGSLFDDVSPIEAASSAGHADHRMVYAWNITGSNLASVRFHLEPVEPGPVAFELVARNVTTVTDLPAVAVDTDPPSLVNFPQPRRFVEVRGRDTVAGPQPASGTLAVQTAFKVAVWIRRTISPVALGATSVWRLVMSATNTGGDPDPFRSVALLVSRVSGVTPVLSAGFDRRLRVAGGARVEATLRALETGLPLADELLRFEVTGGPGGLVEVEKETSARGVARVSYLSPTSEASAGDVVTVAARF